MAELKRLPGDGCLHYLGGRCLYQEHLNPGYATQWRCRVIMHWEDAFDEFLLRVEAMNVAQDAVPDLWSKKFERLARQTFDCEEYVYGPESTPPACLHGYESLCKLSLPGCEGRCRHYEVKKENDLER